MESRKYRVLKVENDYKTSTVRSVHNSIQFIHFLQAPPVQGREFLYFNNFYPLRTFNAKHIENNDDIKEFGGRKEKEKSKRNKNYEFEKTKRNEIIQKIMVQKRMMNFQYLNFYLC